MIHFDFVKSIDLCISIVSAVTYIIILLVPRDTVADCIPPPPLKVGRYNISNSKSSYPKGTVLKFFCDAGYSVSVSNPYIRCIGEGGIGWDLSEFACIPVACGHPGEVANANRNGHLWTFKSKVEYECHEGYVMTSGNAVRYCQANTQWSGELPTCTIINCTRPENPDKGTVLYKDLSYGSILQYKCSYPLAVNSDERRICQANGQWSGSIPKCVEIDCGIPNENFPSGTVDYSQGTQLHDKIIYKCHNGKTEWAKCQPPGIWVPSPPDCMYESIPIQLDTSTSSTTSTTTTTTSTTTTEAPKKGKIMGFICKHRPFRWFCVMG